MKKIATITFHASYNHGSNLQAYALQEFIYKITNNDCEYKIINLRTPRQKEMYDVVWNKKGIKKRIKSILYHKEKKDIITKNELFENFIREKLNLTEEYNSLEELKDTNFDFDYYISGSDQLWNIKAYDFDWANYLEFVKKGKKISYSASFGPKREIWSEEEKKRVIKNLLKYDTISVREEGSYQIIKELISSNPNINIDPTLLLNKDEWLKLINKEKLIKERYILLYDLKEQDETYKIAKNISKKLNIPIYIVKENLKCKYLYRFKNYLKCGPLEFLNLINNAELVLSSSFHGTVFSIIFNKPFYAINGNKDFRINNILKIMGLENRSLEIDNIKEKINDYKNLDFSKSEEILDTERKRSEEYLKNALDIE